MADSVHTTAVNPPLPTPGKADRALIAQLAAMLAAGDVEGAIAFVGVDAEVLS